MRTTYIYDGEDILRERIGSTSRHFVHGPGIDQPLARVTAGSPTYFHADGLGSVVSHTNAQGSVVYSRSYDAFGRLEAGDSESGYAFTGREWDSETRLYYCRARYYDPNLGRFISEDPIGFMGGSNFYEYAHNNSERFTDPSGLQASCCSALACYSRCMNETLFQPFGRLVAVGAGAVGLNRWGNAPSGFGGTIVLQWQAGLQIGRTALNLTGNLATARTAYVAGRAVGGAVGGAARVGAVAFAVAGTGTTLGCSLTCSISACAY